MERVVNGCSVDVLAFILRKPAMKKIYVDWLIRFNSELLMELRREKYSCLGLLSV